MVIILPVEQFIYMELHKMKIKEINCETGEEIIRDATSDEIAQAEKDKAELAAERDANEIAAKDLADKKAAAEAKLVLLGLSADDLKVLGLG